MKILTSWLCVFALLAGAVGCFSSSTMSVRGEKPTYAVYDIEVQRSFESTGKKFRIAVLNGVMDVTLGSEIWFDGQKINHDSRRSNEFLGNDGLNFAQRQGLVVGGELKLTTSRTSLSSMFWNEDIELTSLNRAPAVYSIKLLKKCETHVETDQYTSFNWGGSGIIAIPTRKVHERFSITKPKCFEASDRVFRQGDLSVTDPEVAKQLIVAKAESDVAQAKVTREKSRTELMMRLTREKLSEAHLLAKTATWKRTESSTFEDQLRGAICPETVAIGRLKHIKRVTSDRTETERVNNADGSYSTRSESSITLEFEDGRKDKITVALGDLKIIEGIKAITIRPDGCVDVEARDGRTSRQDEIVKDISDVLKNHFTRLIENEAFEVAGKQYPAD